MPIPLRETFNSAADEYAAIRPGYPEALIEDVIRLSALPAGARLLEIGCGTGQASLPFARRGYPLVCLDIGADLLAAAARNLAAFPNIRFERVAFEDFIPGPEAFNLVFSATAFHWIPLEVGCPKAAELLGPAGALAVFNHEHPRPLTGFFAAVQPIYDRMGPPHKSLSDEFASSEEKIRTTAEKIDSTGLFAPVIVKTYPWKRPYTTAEYLRLLNTYSDHLAMPADSRARLYAAIADLIDCRYNGRMERPYLTVLYLAKKAV